MDRRENHDAASARGAKDGVILGKGSVLKEILYWWPEHKQELVLTILAFVLLLWMWWLFENRWIVVKKYPYSLKRQYSVLNGFKIVQISDLHSTNFGRRQSQLISKIKAQKPDLIFITGDIVDRHDGKDLKEVEALLQGIYEIPANKEFDMGRPHVPIFYVSGNHEITYQYYEHLRRVLANYHVITLDNEFVDLNINDAPKARIMGVMDWGFQKRNDALKGEEWHQWINDNMLKVFESLKSNSENAFHILLSHRPEKFEVYVKAGIDLVFTGHAHGGQIRLPFVGAILAPHQGFFPNYVEGMHTKTHSLKEAEDDKNLLESKTTMIVSRGLGGTKKFPTRFNNRPEIVVLEFI